MPQCPSPSAPTSASTCRTRQGTTASRDADRQRIPPAEPPPRPASRDVPARSYPTAQPFDQSKPTAPPFVVATWAHSTDQGTVAPTGRRARGRRAGVDPCGGVGGGPRPTCAPTPWPTAGPALPWPRAARNAGLAFRRRSSPLGSTATERGPHVGSGPGTSISATPVPCSCATCMVLGRSRCEGRAGVHGPRIGCGAPRSRPRRPDLHAVVCCAVCLVTCTRC